MATFDDHLLAGERVVHRCRPHWILFGLPIALGLAGAALAAGLQIVADDYWYVGAGLAGLALLLAIPPAIRYYSSDYVITDKRVLARMGLLHRRSIETLLTKVEGIGVEQDLPGRLLGYGTLTITGTGGTQESIPCIPAPLEFRRQVQGQIVALDERRGPFGPLAASQPGPGRVERDCPWCAERILARARVCKHCGRDVDPE